MIDLESKGSLAGLSFQDIFLHLVAVKKLQVRGLTAFSHAQCKGNCTQP